MSLHPPRYSLAPPTLRPHASRVQVVFWATVRERLGAMNIVLLAFIFTVVLLQIIIPFYFATLVPGLANGPELSFFYLPFASQVWFFFVVLLTASVGAGVIANDLATRSITMYLARPITHLDYLVAKAAAVAVWITIAVVAPTLLGTTIVLALGYVPLPLALQAAGAFLGVGILTIVAFTGLAVLVSSAAPKSAYAAAAIFGLLAGAEIVAFVAWTISGEPAVLYLSVEQDVLATAQAAFHVPGGVLDPTGAAAILIALGAVTFYLAWRRLATIDAVAE